MQLAENGLRKSQCSSAGRKCSGQQPDAVAARHVALLDRYFALGENSTWITFVSGNAMQAVGTEL